MNLPDNLRGSLLMMASMAAFTFNDACMKAVSDELPIFQAIFLRGVATTLLLGVLAAATGALQFRFRRADAWLIGLRTLAELAATYFFIMALFHMPIANVTAILQALPLSITLAGALFLGEPVGWRRFSAILIGFVGVLLIVQPGAAGFSNYSIYAVVAVVVVTIRDLSARRLSPEVSSLAVALISSAAVTAGAGLATLGEVWQPLSVKGWAQLSGAAFFIIGGYVFSIMTMRVGELGPVTLFRYTGLLWALLIGLIAFGEWPDALTLAGSALVVATGAFTLLREARAKRIRATDAPGRVAPTVGRP